MFIIQVMFAPEKSPPTVTQKDLSHLPVQPAVFSEVGDEKQLPATVLHKRARESGLGISLFEFGAWRLQGLDVKLSALSFYAETPVGFWGNQWIRD